MAPSVDDFRALRSRYPSAPPDHVIVDQATMDTLLCVMHKESRACFRSSKRRVSRTTKLALILAAGVVRRITKRAARSLHVATTIAMISLCPSRLRSDTGTATTADGTPASARKPESEALTVGVTAPDFPPLSYEAPRKVMDWKPVDLTEIAETMASYTEEDWDNLRKSMEPFIKRLEYQAKHPEARWTTRPRQ